MAIIKYRYASDKTNILNMQDEYRGFVKSLFVESLDYLVISSLDGKICKYVVFFSMLSGKDHQFICAKQ
jgi:hypothetical protein